MTQYVINIGAIPNDGTGDPLRTAFNETNLNFDQVFAAGPVLSNVQIANNTILTTTTNGNLILAPNGIGRIQANATIVPSVSNVRDLGSADRRWSTVYVQYANVSGALGVANLTATGDVTVGGNLSVTGNIIYIGNLITDAKTIQLANTAGTANAANGSGITVGADDNIATFLYDSAFDAWYTNNGLRTTANVNGGNLRTSGLISATGNITTAGNVTANYFIGNGSELTAITGANVTGTVANAAYATLSGSSVSVPAGNITGLANVATSGNYNDLSNIPSPYGDSNVTSLLATFGSNTITTTGNVTADYLFGNGSQLTGLNTNRILNGTSNVEIATANGNVTVTANDTYNWTFSTDGNTILPGQSGWVTSTANSSVYFAAMNNGIDPIATISNWNMFNGMSSSQIEVRADSVWISTDGTNVQKDWIFDNTGNLQVPGDIVPAGNNTQSLGNATNQWADLYLSGNTIYLGDLSLSAGPTGLTSTAGFDLGNSVATEITANVLSANAVNIGTGGIGIGDDNYLVVETLVPGGLRPSNDDMYNLGNVSHRWAEVHANVYYGDGSQLTGLESSIIANGNSSVFIPGLDSPVEVVVDGNSWTFDNTGNLTAPGNITTVGNITGNYFIGNGSQLTDLAQALVKPNNLLYVAKNGNDTTGTGSINAPYLTIQAAINAAAGNTATTIILAPGNYAGDLSINNVTNALNITGSGLAESTINGNIVISGTSNNIEFDNLRIVTGRVTHSATGYWSVINSRFSANTGITKTSSSTIKIFNTDLGAAGTGNVLLQGGKTNIYSSQVFNAQVSGTGTEVNFLQCDTVIVPTVISGNVNFIDTNIVSSGSGNSLNAVGGYVTLKNCLSITPSRTLAPIGFGAGSSYSYGDSGFDVGNSTFAGTAIVQAGQYQAINVRGGNITTNGLVSATGNVTGGNILTGGLISATGNITGNYFIGNGSQLTGLPSSYSDANVTTLLSSFGSNSISTTGNVTAQNFTGNISITGNVTGTSANVTLVAGSYSTVFDNTGVATFPRTTVTVPVALADLTAVAGGRAFVNNANLTASGNFGAQVGSGGSNVVPVWSDGVNWYIG